MTRSDVPIEAAFDALPGQVAVLDEDGHIVLTNRAWRRFAAANDGGRDHVGADYLAVCDGADDERAARTAAGIRRLLAGGKDAVAVEYPCHAPDRERWFTMRAIRFDHGGERYVLVMHVDITERKRAELAVRAQNDRLETVSSVLSHDLRNPLNVALGRAEMVDSEHADAVVQSLERMEAIVEDALVLARHDDPAETSRVELADAAERAWGYVETGEAELSIVDSSSFEADPDLLSHVFENLYRNAIEHGASTVTVGAFDRGFYVEDDGPGIPTADRDAVFDSDFSTTDGGTGLGLAIVEHVAEAHGWTVRATEASLDGDARAPHPITSDGGPVKGEPTPSRGARFEVAF
ncbi:ATP-binding protein [Halorussus halobius]|uniref:ATP-binding protein n=1 Tax=Halorussus halobius TaxID=1710537 RepID=UPI001091EF3C|nr:PAS domain-containing sensor histidine kinase [Halorussus halobius]